MTATPSTTPGARPARRRSRRDDAGYVLALSALLIIPLFAFAGLAVDLGSWYARGTAIQRATDAASLAGAGSLPRGVATAQGVALQVAAQNGFTNGDGVTVTAVHVPPDQMRVTITDSDVPQYLTGVFRSQVSVSRTSLAEYVPPVKMGSPRNYLGMGTIEPGSGMPRDNFWLAISSPCASKENGDRIQTISDANFPSSGGFSCTGGGTVSNDEHEPNGYFYALRFESDYSGSVTIEAYDPAACYGNWGYIDGTGSDTMVFDTTFQVRNNDSADPTAATPIGSARTYRGNGSGSGVCSSPSPWNPGGTRNSWVPLHTLNNPTRGTYYIQVRSSNPYAYNRQGGTNSFALRAREGSTFSPCTTESPTSLGYRTNCPNLYAVDHLGVAATIGGSTPSWYLADIGPEHSGKTMEVALWDPGEGSVALELLNPLGVAVPFRWRVDCAGGATPPTGGCGPGTTSMLDLVGSPPNPQPGPRRLSDSKYSDRLLILEVELPDNINTAYGGLTWWRIRYTSGTEPTDRTTWGVTIKGDPVRLVE